MYFNAAQWVFSPSDLTTFVDSEYASWMEHYRCAYPERAPEPDAADSMMGLLQDKGEVHEQAVLAAFIAEGLQVADISTALDKAQATTEAMAQGVEVIFQACLEKAPFKGYADFLVKVPGPSVLGDYHYEVWDSKLSNTVKPYFVMQLCCYAEMLEALQGCRAEYMVVALGDGVRERLRCEDYFYYYHSVKSAFLQWHAAFNPEQPPHPGAYARWGRWAEVAQAQLVAEDHLSQVATLTRVQIKHLEAAGITTMQQLAEAALPPVSGLTAAQLQRLQRQALLQKQSQDQPLPAYEVVAHAPGVKQGLALLPPHCDADVFFDIEGFPLVEGGLEYLWGASYFDEQGQRQFIDFWAHDAEQEKQAFKGFITWAYARWQRDPAMHIYHYANYEIAACRKLMSRYGVCEFEVDQLLRNEVFVDLYKLFKGAIILGEPNYSIKSVEHLYRPQRDTEVGNGGDSVVVYEQWRENPDGLTWQTSKVLKAIRDYNIDDCDSTQELVDWLRVRQQEEGIAFIGKVEVDEPELSEEVTARTALRDKLLAKAEALREDASANADEGLIKQAAFYENLAWLLEFHRRESKPVFWRLFDRLGLSHVELIDDLDCLACCERSDTPPYKISARKKKQCFEYHFNPEQEFKAGGKQYYLLGEEEEGGSRAKVSLVKQACDFAAGVLVVEAMQEPPALISLVPDDYVNPNPIPQAIDAVVRGIEQGEAGHSAITDFLQRRPPRIQGLAAGQPIVSSAHALDDVVSAIVNLQQSYLPIQGPPGAGKTYTGKHVIAALLERGLTVGICSNSHKAINNLLIGSAAYCQQQGIAAYFACTKDTDEQLQALDIAVLKNAEIAQHVDQACVIGTTAWGFARDDLAEQFDVIFIDEAGQVSVANLMAISRATTNFVLLGDQMQLGQPAQGTHPAESGLSTLDYLLHESPTIAADRGVFLGTTYRMHSAVNDFISAAIYEGKLNAHPSNDGQRVLVPKHYERIDQEAGIVVVDVAHEGNTQASSEEVAAIVALSAELMGRTFIDKNGDERAVSWEDMLFVAPYNHQVNLLQQALGDAAKVGSVDKFQGQEAPIVILSMCASDASNSARGLDFLLDKNRLNVAISRAQALAIVVANPKLAQTPATTLQQQAKVNVFCRLLQQGKALKR